ncbi:class C beta-lactamase [Phyllobacterium endophyticum]|uniref:Beta-lactamase n=1 Tax=Phyllobacterium endophyticum TaxID=1149773 RepID=A0A2P7ANU8_9HYPH|nr:class C beta-lactamase [Phyllobacterium endophyticum]MBB3233782.1 beta-lactamase class C [Phyllobacterium endophyticum]PSH55880.1 class C beta-lactamase [Phyllobacterium endophyticum]TYR41020.1 beta-lactamase [Phyllobacterium endophyticum]
MSLKCFAPALVAVLLSAAALNTVQAAEISRSRVEGWVNEAVRPVMKQYDIPGMAVGIIIRGKSFVFNHGSVTMDGSRPITDRTLFEIGSISKTFTATLASYAEVNGDLSLTDATEKYVPVLRGSPFGAVDLVHLATHTPGGFPLQFPDHVKNEKQMLDYFRQWQPAFRPGTHRTYANPSIGMLGYIAARSMREDFSTLVEQKLFGPLDMSSSYVNVPNERMADYAQGYTKDGRPVRMSNAVLSAEAYGVRTTARDLVQFLKANMSLVPLDKKLGVAITNTHAGYFRVGAMTQDLVWEQYDYPAKLATLLEGNSQTTSRSSPAVEQIQPPLPPRDDVLINKTGSTNGFGAYVAFIPEEQMGFVILANRYYPNEERVRIVHQLLERLAGANQD